MQIDTLGKRELETNERANEWKYLRGIRPVGANETGVGTAGRGDLRQGVELFVFETCLKHVSLSLD